MSWLVFFVVTQLYVNRGIEFQVKQQQFGPYPTPVCEKLAKGMMAKPEIPMAYCQPVK